MADLVEKMPPSPVGGRPPLDPDGSESRRIPGVFLGGPDADLLDALTARVVARNGVTVAHARRMILLAGVRAVTASLDASDDLHREARSDRAAL